VTASTSSKQKSTNSTNSTNSTFSTLEKHLSSFSDVQQQVAAAARKLSCIVAPYTWKNTCPAASAAVSAPPSEYPAPLLANQECATSWLITERVQMDAEAHYLRTCLLPGLLRWTYA